MKQSICLKACSDIAQGIAQNERKAIAGWARFPGERWELRINGLETKL